MGKGKLGLIFPGLVVILARALVLVVVVMVVRVGSTNNRLLPSRRLLNKTNPNQSSNSM